MKRNWLSLRNGATASLIVALGGVLGTGEAIAQVAISPVVGPANAIHQTESVTTWDAVPRPVGIYQGSINDIEDGVALLSPLAALDGASGMRIEHSKSTNVPLSVSELTSGRYLIIVELSAQNNTIIAYGTIAGTPDQNGVIEMNLLTGWEGDVSGTVVLSPNTDNPNLTDVSISISGQSLGTESGTVLDGGDSDHDNDGIADADKRRERENTSGSNPRPDDGVNDPDDDDWLDYDWNDDMWEIDDDGFDDDRDDDHDQDDSDDDRDDDHDRDDSDDDRDDDHDQDDSDDDHDDRDDDHDQDDSDDDRDDD